VNAYPTISARAGRLFFDSYDPASWRASLPRPEDLPIDWVDVVSDTPTTADLGVDALYSLARRAKQAVDRGEYASGNGGERFEAAHALSFHKLLNTVPGEILTNRSFWRFLALGPFFAATVWRQREKHLDTAFGLPPATGRRRGGDSLNLVRNLPWRLYMRAEIGRTQRLVDIIGADLWWSHIFRVQIGRSPVTAQAFLQEVGAEPVAVQRAVAPYLSADRGRNAYDSLDADEIVEHVLEQKAKAIARFREHGEEPESDPASEEEQFSDSAA